MEILEAEIVRSLDEIETDIQCEIDAVQRGSNNLKVLLHEVKATEAWKDATDNLGSPLYVSFPNYLDTRWGLSKSWGHDLAAAGKVIQELRASAIADDEMPKSEHALMALSKAAPKDRPAVLHAAQRIAGGKPTAPAIEQARKIITPEPGQKVAVVQPGHPYEGEVITVNETHGKQGSTFTSVEHGGWPFLAGEVDPVEAEPVQPEAQIITPARRARMYRELLERIAAEWSAMPPELRVELEAALRL